VEVSRRQLLQGLIPTVAATFMFTVGRDWTPLHMPL
jgi:hypothetical protein